MRAIAHAAQYGERRRDVLAHDDPRHLIVEPRPAPPGTVRTLDEWEGKQVVSSAGIHLPEGHLCDAATAPRYAEDLGYPVVVKRVDAALAHKSEAGAVHLGLKDAAAVKQAVASIQASADGAPDRFLVERMVGDAVAELLVSIRREESFGHVLVLASGGVLVELLADAQTLLLPADRASVESALTRLKASALIDGYRGRPRGDREAATDAILALAEFAQSRASDLIELEINPLIVRPSGVAAVDVLMRVSA